MGVTSGVYECALALGAEKLYSEDKAKAFRAYWSGIDVENMEAYMVQLRDVSNGLSLDIPVEDDDEGAGKNRSGAMDIYSTLTRWHMDKYGTTQRQLAVIASKNHFHSTMNPNAQFQKDMSIDEILAARLVSWPLTVPMCAPVGDGAAAAIVCSANFLKKVVSARPVCIRASVMGSGTDRDIAEDRQDISARVSQKAYEISGLGPDDIDVAELHDATAFGELQHSEAVGFCTKLGGRLPINPSGGLESRGHPLGASGLGQIHEIVTQLRHDAGPRQVENCRIGLAENGGGLIGFEGAALGIHILERLEG
jgi:acetyl-CoA acetyltransferase